MWESRLHFKDCVSSVFSGLYLGRTRELHLYSQRELSLYLEASSRFVTLKITFPHQTKGASSLWRKLVAGQHDRAASLQQREVRVSTLKFALHFNKVRAASLLRCSRLANEWEPRFYFSRDPRLQYNMTFASTRPVFILSFRNQFNSILAKADDYFPWLDSTPTTSSEHRGGLHCVSRHSRWSSLVASKRPTVYSRGQEPDKIELKVSQKIASSILRACC